MVTRCTAVCLLGVALSTAPGCAQAAAAAPAASDATGTVLTHAQGDRILYQARAAHYSLWGAGMDGLACKVQPALTIRRGARV